MLLRLPPESEVGTTMATAKTTRVGRLNAYLSRQSLVDYQRILSRSDDKTDHFELQVIKTNTSYIPSDARK
jgi:hypothetical protein